MMRSRFLEIPTGAINLPDMRRAVQPPPSVVVPVNATAALGVTLVSPKYQHLAEEAVARFQKNTGLDVVILTAKEENSFAAKLNLDLMVAAVPIVFFDVDLWIIRKYDFSPLLKSGKWCAVPDPGSHNPHAFPHTDCQREGWNHDTYFNSGLFVCDLSRPDHRRVFQDARQRLTDVHEGLAGIPADWTDQYFLNWAIQQQPALLKRLPFELNFYKLAVDWGSYPHIPREVIGLHAAGRKPDEKLSTLKREAAVFGEPSSPMLF
jgi:hypothetical protein